jgi:O-antigen ligase
MEGVKQDIKERSYRSVGSRLRGSEDFSGSLRGPQNLHGKNESPEAIRNDIFEKRNNMERDRIIQHFDNIILSCLCVLVIFLPIAHTETIRAFSLGIPVGLWFLKSILSRRFLFTRTPADLPILLFTLVAGLSVITAVDPRYSLEEFIGEWIIGVFLFYMVVNNIRSEQVKYILGALLLGNVIMVSYGVFDFFRDGGLILQSKVRATSLHSGVGTFSTYLVTVIPYLMITLFFVPKNFKFFMLGILLGLNFFALALTYSRGSLVAIGGLLLLTGWRFLPRKVFAILIVTLGIGGSFLATERILAYYHRFTVPPPVGFTPDSYHGRWILSKFTLEQIRDNPFQMNGFGRRTFAKKFHDFVEQYKGAMMWHAHNTFLDLAIQTGLQGLVLFCFLLYKMLKYCQKMGKSGESPIIRYYSLATYLMIIAFFVRNFSDDFFVDDSALLFWLLCGMVFGLSKDIENQRPALGST